MFGISFEHLLIVGVILLVVGPRRLPELGHTMGKAIKNFKDSFSGIEEAAFKRVEEQKKNAHTSSASAAAQASTTDGATAETISTTNANTTTTPHSEPRV